MVMSGPDINTKSNNTYNDFDYQNGNFKTTQLQNSLEHHGSCLNHAQSIFSHEVWYCSNLHNSNQENSHPQSCVTFHETENARINVKPRPSMTY